MSTTTRTSNASVSKFTLIFQTACSEYERLTGHDIATHPFSTNLDSCNSPDRILHVLKEQTRAITRYHKRDEKLLAWLLDPIVHVLLAFSSNLVEGIGLPFLPAKIIFTGISVLLCTVKDVVTRYEKLILLFDRLHHFLERLDSYTSIPLTPAMVVLLGKIMAQVLLVLALSAKAMKEKRIKTFIKRLFGRTDVEDALLRLDTLTKEETLMTAARALEVTHHIDSNVTTVKEFTQDIHKNVATVRGTTQDIHENVAAVNRSTQGIHKNVAAVNRSTQGIHKNVAAVNRSTQDIRNNVRVVEEVTRHVDHAIGQLRENQSRKTLRSWLSPPDPSINHNIACAAHHKGTASWFVHGGTFREWKTNGSSLWIRGNPGCGKSVLCSAIIEDIKHMQKTMPLALIAYYYFDFNEVTKRGVRGLLSSLLIQLADRSDQCLDALSKLYTTCRDGSEQPSEDTLVQCLNEILELPGQIPVYIIIDALDECPNNVGSPSARKKVLDFVEDLIQRRHANLYLCIASRPEQDIQSTLNPLIRPPQCVSLHKKRGQRQDINKYIRSFVHENEQMRRWKAEDKELVINTLTERAEGMFRWVYCQLDALSRCFPQDIRKALDGLPRTLDKTYERTLQGIAREKQEHARHLFQFLVAAVRPLQVGELAEIFAIKTSKFNKSSLRESWRPENPEEAILSACSTLITIVEHKDSKIVQFSHYSVKEFLTSHRLRTSGVGDVRQYHIPLDVAHSSLAGLCFTMLLLSSEEMDQKPARMLPLAPYSAQHWVDHVKYRNIASQFRNSMECLLDPRKPHFGAWIQIYNIDDGKEPCQATPLYYAVLCGFTGLANRLIVAHAEDVNAKCGHHGSPLHAASYRGHLNTVRLLLDRGADVNTTIEQKTKSPLCSAYNGGHPEVMRLLLENGADPDVKGPSDGDLKHLLHIASAKGQVGVLRLLLQHNADVNVRDRDDYTPLHCASARGHVEVVKFLLEHGADVDSQTVDLLTPLMIASERGHLDTVQILLKHGANVFSRDIRKLTPLHYTSQEGRVQARVHDLLLAKVEADRNRPRRPDYRH